MQVVTRFAPSPTGKLHLGHAWSALQAHDFARARGGAFLLRIEDIDPGRARAEHVDSIIEDLLWLGLNWDGEIAYQSERLDLYSEALDRLMSDGLVYPCFCTRAEVAAEIAASASAPHGPEGPVYPGTCRKLPASERKMRMSERPHAWRLDMVRALQGTGPLHWLEGDQAVTASPEIFGDVVIARKDAPASYHLAVTIDDSAQGISDVVRGADLRSSTHVHRLLQALLELRSPVYHHHDLLLDLQGRRLAKREGAPTLMKLREAGHDPVELVEALRSRQLPAGYILGEA
jgi:glutamyl-Q tRNA(Asp) synthetase